MAGSPFPFPSTLSDWLSWIFVRIQNAGSLLPGEPRLNFLAPFVATDNPSNTSTDISLSVAPGVQPEPVITYTPGGTVTLLADTTSWNESESSVAVTYQFPVDTIPVERVIGWSSLVAPTVTAPAGWVVQNPVNGDTTQASYVYGSGAMNPFPGERWKWVAIVALQRIVAQ